MATVIRVAICAGMAGARLVELRISRRNMARAGETREGAWSRSTYPLIVVLHAITIGGTLLRGRGLPRVGWLAALVAAQPLRVWVLGSLGWRWNARAAVPREMTVVTAGPYRFVRHPNYDVVAVELATLPLAFGLPGLAVAATTLNAVLLAPRILEEERGLMQVPGYAEHFARKPRFIPGLI